jgi:hypothetical protein
MFSIKLSRRSFEALPCRLPRTEHIRNEKSAKEAKATASTVTSLLQDSECAFSSRPVACAVMRPSLNHICESAHTIDGWPHDVPMNYDLSVPALNLHQALQEWRICSPCWNIGQHLYLPVWMRERIGQSIMYKYIP